MKTKIQTRAEMALVLIRKLSQADKKDVLPRSILVVLLLVLFLVASHQLTAQSCAPPNYNDVSIKGSITLTTTLNSANVGNMQTRLLDGQNNNDFFFPSNNWSLQDREVVRMQFPNAVALKGLEIASDGSFYAYTTSTRVDASNDGNTWTTLFTNPGGDAGQPFYGGCEYGSCGFAARYPFPGNTTAYLYYRIYGVSGNYTNRYVHELYFDLAEASSGLADIACTYGLDNGITTDDEVTFTLNPSLATSSGNYTVTSNQGAPTPGTAPLGQATSFTLPPGTVASGDITLTITDVTASCTLEATIPNVPATPYVDTDGDGVGDKLDPIPSTVGTAVQAPCANASDSPLTSLILTGPEGQITKAAYTVGTVYFGPDFFGAATVSGLPGGAVVANDIPNPDFTTYYVIRGYQSENVFQDYVVEVDKTVCSVADLSIAVTPETGTANESENVVYTVTLTNNGPDPAVNVQVRVDTPDGLEVLANTPSMGMYSASSALWEIDEVPVGDQTLVITYRMK